MGSAIEQANISRRPHEGSIDLAAGVVPKQDNHESPEPAQPVPGHGTARLDDIVEEEEKVNELAGRKVGDVGVVHGRRVRITAIYKNGNFDYEPLSGAQ